MDLISDLTFDLAFVSNVLREIECGSRARPRKGISDVPRGLGDGTPKLCAVRGARSRGLGLVEVICDNFGSSNFSHASRGDKYAPGTLLVALRLEEMSTRLHDQGTDHVVVAVVAV